MKNRIGAAFAAGAVFGGVMMTVSSGQAATSSYVRYGWQPVLVTQHMSTFDAPYCYVSERHRIVEHKLDGTRVKRHPWSTWETVDAGKPAPATDGTICAVAHS